MKKLFSVILFLTYFLPLNAGAQMHWEPAAIHIATTVSDGTLSADQIIDAARQKNINIVILTDRDFMRWEYGFWPLRHLIKKVVESNSIYAYGFDNYLNLIKLESSKNPGMVIIPGFEAAPYYHWSGSPLYGNLRLSDWHKHILVLGIETADDFNNLPVLSNPLLPKKFSLKHIFLLCPLLTLILGAIFLTKRESTYSDSHGNLFIKYSFKWRVAGFSVIVLSLLFFFNNLFSPSFEFNQYSDYGSSPYQKLIDYANQKGALTFWAHPEAKNISRRGNIKIETWAHEADLWNTQRYTGYSIFFEGYNQVGKIGGDWDYLLNAYCSGERSSPVWAIGGLAFDSGSVDAFKKLLDDVRTYLLVDKLDVVSVLDAIGSGRAYVSRGIEDNRLFLDSFMVSDLSRLNGAGIGQELVVKGAPFISIKWKFSSDNYPDSGFQIKLVRDGKVIKVFNESQPLEALFEDGQMPVGKSFYRLEIKNGRQLVVTNPIFVVRQ